MPVVYIFEFDWDALRLLRQWNLQGCGCLDCGFTCFWSDREYALLFLTTATNAFSLFAHNTAIFGYKVMKNVI